MPSDGYTTVTISEEIVAKLSRVMANHDMKFMSLAIDDAAQLALDEEPMTMWNSLGSCTTGYRPTKTSKSYD
jgi:hypothetical protein